MHDIQQQFLERFGRQPKWQIRAPGRVNIIGDHTDYNDGFVLPMAIEHAVWLAAAPRSQPGIDVYSANLQLGEVFGHNHDPLTISETWTDYIKGVVAEYQKRGMAMPGLEILVWSDVPMGCGLSSSAALQIGTARLLQVLEPDLVPDSDIAALCQTAEHNFTGMPAGIMDQFCVAYARKTHLMSLDCRSLEVDHIRMDDSDIAILIIDSQVSRELRDGAYARRRTTCEEACKILGVSHLRDVSSEQVVQARESLSELHFKRARHVTTEDERTLGAVAAIAQKDWRRVGKLMHESHLSLSNDYETSCKELDILNQLAHELGPGNGIYGARITGGGFGGCAVALIERQCASQIVDTLRTQYREATSLTLKAYTSTPAQGAGLVSNGDDDDQNT